MQGGESGSKSDEIRYCLHHGVENAGFKNTIIEWHVLTLLLLKNLCNCRHFTPSK